jgi:hypothetical protein
MGVKVSFKFSIANLHSNEFPAAASLTFPASSALVLAYFFHPKPTLQSAQTWKKCLMFAGLQMSPVKTGNPTFRRFQK